MCIRVYSTVTDIWREISGNTALFPYGTDANRCRNLAVINTATIAKYLKIAEEGVDAGLYGNMEISMLLTPTVLWARIRSMRAPYQVLIFPYLKSGNGYLYAIFKREDLNFWQAISGGGENRETPVQAAKREAFEEAKISVSSRYIKLDSMTTIPVVDVGNYKWIASILVLPEYSFGVEVSSTNLTIGTEHSVYKWLPYEKARKLLKYDSNKSALWELHYRLTTK